MPFLSTYLDREQEIIDLFAETFAASEGKDEGALIGALTGHLMAETAEADLYLFATEEEGHLTGAVFMSRLTFPQDNQVVFMLAPVAVATACQGKGIGQRLIRHALEEMAAKGADIAVTYGDPNYYGRVGFQPVSADDLAPPMPLHYPHGWQAQSLTGAAKVALKGPSDCVSAFRDPAYW